MAEELNLDHFDLGTFVDYVYALKQERDALRARLPSQGGEAVKAAMLAAAPAAPAANAGIVDMYRHLQKVTPYRFKKIQDASITDCGDVMYFHKDRFDAALLADMAALAAPAADAWIQVSERLPAVESRLDQECRVGTLSIAPLNISAAVLVFDGEKVKSTRLEWFDGCLPLPYCITHWMPLPAAPIKI